MGASKWCPSEVTQCVVSSRDGHRGSRVIGVSPRRSTRVRSGFRATGGTSCIAKRGTLFCLAWESILGIPLVRLCSAHRGHHRLARDAPVTTSHQLQASGWRDTTMTADPIAIRSCPPIDHGHGDASRVHADDCAACCADIVDDASSSRLSVGPRLAPPSLLSRVVSMSALGAKHDPSHCANSHFRDFV